MRVKKQESGKYFSAGDFKKKILIHIRSETALSLLWVLLHYCGLCVDLVGVYSVLKMGLLERCNVEHGMLKLLKIHVFVCHNIS